MSGNVTAVGMDVITEKSGEAARATSERLSAANDMGTAQPSKLRAYRASRRDEDLLFRPCRVTNKVVVPAIPQ